MRIYLRNRIWWVEYQVDGEKHRQSTHTKNKAVATAWANQIKIAKKMPTFDEAVEVLKMFYKKPVDGILPIESLWETYHKLARATGKDNLAERTMKRRENTVVRFVAWLKKNRPTVKTVEAVTGPIAAGFASCLSDGKLKTKTRINIIAELSTVWKLLENASTGVRNPWTALRPQDVDGERGRAFSAQDERLVLDAAKKVGKQWYEVCMVMRHTGLRYGDVARLRWDEIDKDVIRIVPSKTTRHRISVVVPIIRPLRAVLKSMPRKEECVYPIEDGFVFPMHAYLTEHTGDKSRILPFREVLDEAGLSTSGYTVHSWRHTAATRLAESGADIETRKRILGHTVDETARRYDHDEHISETRKALESAV